MSLSQPPKKAPAWLNRTDDEEASFHHEEEEEGATVPTPRTRDREAVEIADIAIAACESAPQTAPI